MTQKVLEEQTGLKNLEEQTAGLNNLEEQTGLNNLEEEIPQMKSLEEKAGPVTSCGVGCTDTAFDNDSHAADDQNPVVAGKGSDKEPHHGLREAVEILNSLSLMPKILKPWSRKRKTKSAAVVTSFITVQNKDQ